MRYQLIPRGRVDLLRLALDRERSARDVLALACQHIEKGLPDEAARETARRALEQARIILREPT